MEGERGPELGRRGRTRGDAAGLQQRGDHLGAARHGGEARAQLAAVEIEPQPDLLQGGGLRRRQAKMVERVAEAGLDSLTQQAQAEVREGGQGTGGQQGAAENGPRLGRKI